MLSHRVSPSHLPPLTAPWLHHLPSNTHPLCHPLAKSSSPPPAPFRVTQCCCFSRAVILSLLAGKEERAGERLAVLTSSAFESR